MAETWVVVAWLVLTTAAIRAAGPVSLAGRDLPPRTMGVIALLAPALLAALVVTETFQSSGGDFTVDERLIGVAGAGGVLAFRGGILLAMAVAMGLAAAGHAVLG